MDTDQLLSLLRRAALAVDEALADQTDWGLIAGSAEQHHSDIRADAAAQAILGEADIGVVSEESDNSAGSAPIVVIVDPLDGSTNAAHRIPWYATSLCALDETGPLVSVVRDLVSHTEYSAVRGQGAERDGASIRTSGVDRLDEAIVAVSGLPPAHLGWRQFRCLGAAALDLCAVADGRLDAFYAIDGAHHGWDYLGGMLICEEAGGVVVDGRGEDLVVRDRSVRMPLAAATTELGAALLAAGRSAGLGAA